MLGYSHPMKNTNLPSWFYKEERVSAGPSKFHITF